MAVVLWQLGAAREPVIALVWQRLPPTDLVRLRRTSRACAAEAAEAARRVRRDWERTPWAPAPCANQRLLRFALSAVGRSDAIGRDCCARLCDWFGVWDGPCCWPEHVRAELLDAVGRLGRSATARLLLADADPGALLVLLADIAGFRAFGRLARMLNWSLCGRGMQAALATTLLSDTGDADAWAVLRAMRPTDTELRQAAAATTDGRLRAALLGYEQG